MSEKMTNEKKYVTPEERVKAFKKFCGEVDANVCGIKCVAYGTNLGANGCFARWLALEAEDEEPMPCPFCGGNCYSKRIYDDGPKYIWRVFCKGSDGCGYKSRYCDTEAAAIAAHNRVARAVRAANESEVK